MYVTNQTLVCHPPGILLMVQWVDLLAAERRATVRDMNLMQTSNGGNGVGGRSIHALLLPESGQHATQRTPSVATRPVGVVMQRTVALIPFGDDDLGAERGILVRELGLGVQFDLSSEVGVVVSAVDVAVAKESGLAVGDRVISLAGVAVAADHDPLAALDEAEDAIRGAFR